jgi:hypothetical protein
MNTANWIDGRARLALIVLLALGLGYLAMADGIASALANRSPPLATTVAPWHGAAWARTAELAAATQPNTAGHRVAADYALTALRRDPGNARAVRTLGEAMRQTGRGAPGLRLARLSQRLSWRDLPTQLLASRDALRAGNGPLGLRHLSAGLLTEQRSWPIIMPQLVAATADPALARPLAQVLALDPQWTDEFNRTWITGAPRPQTMALLSAELDRIGHPLTRDTRTGVMARLVAAREWTLARAEYARGRPDLANAGRTLSDGYPAARGFAPFDWTMSDDSNVTAAFESGRGSARSISAEYEGPGDVEIARRLLVLAPGSYRFIMPITLDAASERGFAANEGLSVRVVCAEQGGQTLGEGIARSGVVTANATIPTGCAAQWLSVRIRTNAPGIIVVRARAVSLASGATSR